ncbi:hypothetical protein SISNIDRAFT_549545 [Sistotremastrum niveocremeum HHB9708]|uniref:F-box domain-containing protein n=2 Tax=Sistotremastraceae TaxID=3402574 RepID=A0A164V3I9_9AGAM|nr:hypothetical protein SISNIDRAFT_549545 [Sistotremastrum niveocremeum HHB9708]KZT37361.1 hypothetical protein SISSUDRAFT_1129682 [Sistotremastrum suecicum HHB10207 ss-3]
MSSSATEQTYPNIAYELQKNTQTKNVFPLTAMEKFWTIPELVARTIRPEFLSRQALYSCSLVSKSLSHHALAAQYQSGVSIMNWLGLLAPLVPSETPNTHETNFARSLVLEDWDRFSRYARLAKSISSTSDPLCGMSPDSLVQLLALIPAGHVLFPRLKTLAWEGNSAFGMRIINLFLHGGLAELIITGRPEYMSDTSTLISRSCPQLSRLKFRLPQEHTDVPANVQDEFAVALQSLHKLEELELPSGIMSVSITKTLSQRPNLRVLWVSTTCCCVNMNARTSIGTSSDLEHTEFPHLRDLSSEITLLLSTPKIYLMAPCLENLHIQIPTSRSKEEFQLCVSILTENCKALVALSFWFVEDGSLGEVDEDEESPITASIIKELLKLPALENLELDHARPPNLDDDDLAELALKCSSLSVLNICMYASSGSHARWRTPTLASLIPFALHCPELANLGYFMDASIVPDLPSFKITPFPKLQTLDIADHTKINDPMAVAAFLVSLLSPESKIAVDPLHCFQWTDGDIMDTNQHTCEFRKEWDQVEKMVAAFKVVRQRLTASLTNGIAQ